jgi:hypothetical protein
MLCHKLSCPKSRLLLSVLMLEDAGRNRYAVASVDEVVSHEPLYFADEEQEALIHNPPRFARVTHTLVAPYRDVQLSATLRDQGPGRSSLGPSPCSCLPGCVEGRSLMKNFLRVRFHPGSGTKYAGLGTVGTRLVVAISPVLTSQHAGVSSEDRSSIIRHGRLGSIS